MFSVSVYTHKNVGLLNQFLEDLWKDSESKSRRQSDTEAASQGDVIGRDSLCPGWSLAEHRSCPGLQRPEETSTPLVNAVQGGGTESPGSQGRRNRMYHNE